LPVFSVKPVNRSIQSQIQKKFQTSERVPEVGISSKINLDFGRKCNGAMVPTWLTNRIT